nr:MAG TPA: hypothetical protein [Caudoviricetes sp.]
MAIRTATPRTPARPVHWPSRRGRTSCLSA